MTHVAGFALCCVAAVGGAVGTADSRDAGGASSSASTIPATTTSVAPGAPPPTHDVSVVRSDADADEPLCDIHDRPPQNIDQSADSTSANALLPMMSVVNTYGVPLGQEFHGAGQSWNDDGERVVVAAFVANVAEHRDALDDLVDDADRLVVCRARLTTGEGAAIVAEIQPLLAEFEHAFGPNGMDGRVEVNVLAGHEATAQMLHAEYGDQLDLTLGAFPYPMPDPLPEPVCPDLAATNPDLPYAVEAPETVVLEPAAGPGTSVSVPFVNATSERIAFLTGYPWMYLTDRDTGAVVGVPNGNFGREDLGIPVDLEPGAVFEQRVRVPTASCDPSIGHTLPPGDYDLYAVYNVVADTTNIDTGDFAVGPVPVTITDGASPDRRDVTRASARRRAVATGSTTGG